MVMHRDIVLYEIYAYYEYMYNIWKYSIMYAMRICYVHYS